jgi:foldase protein PrsA
MDDRNTSQTQHEQSSVEKFNASRKQGKGASVFITGALIAAMAVGVSWQLVRAKGPQQTAAEKQRKEIGRTDVLGQPAVRINGELITREVLAKECLEQFGAKVLESVINRTIIQQACAEKGVTVTDNEVTAEVNRISKKVSLPIDQWYKMILAERGLTPMQYHRDVIWPLLALRKLAGTKVDITDKMFKEAYYDNYGPRVKAKMIVVDNSRRGQELAEKLQADPDKFEEFARDFSVEPNSKSLGGSIPPIRRYSGAHEELRNTAFRMKKEGEISPLIQVGPAAYAILKYEGRTEPVDHNPEDVKAELYEELHEREVQMLVAATFDELKKKARVDNYLTGETTSPIRRASATSEDKVPFEFSEPSLN